MGETGPVTTGDTVYDPNFVMMRQEGCGAWLGAR
jgi:hypothetical protein